MADLDPESKLLLLAAEGNLRTIENLVQSNCKVCLFANEDGVTALMLAADANRPSVVNLLLKYESRIDYATKEGWTALMAAANK
ncbi:ankyrin repeat domain-containing protein, partial [Plakobranchus ocellatus]